VAEFVTTEPLSNPVEYLVRRVDGAKVEPDRTIDSTLCTKDPKGFSDDGCFPYSVRSMEEDARLVENKRILKPEKLASPSEEPALVVGPPQLTRK
jgi:hypothetical protein